MHVREATREDADPIGAVHERAVRELAAEDYDDEVLDAWTSLAENDDEDAETDEGDADRDGRADEESTSSEDDEWQPQPEDGRRFVAEVEGEDSPEVAGFGDVRFDPPEYLSEPTDGGVRAVYVDPDHARDGVGTALLERLEREARGHDVGSLGLLASVNAVPFYEAHGYEVVAETTFDFGGGVEGPAVEMRTDL